MVGSGSGNTGTSVLRRGVISTDSAFNTETFQDLSQFEYVLIKVYDTVNSVNYDWTVIIPTSLLSSSEYGITVPLHQAVTYAITLTNIRCTYYRGNYYYVYADIIGFNEYPFN
jgi:hypothetical protein